MLKKVYADILKSLLEALNEFNTLSSQDSS